MWEAIVNATEFLWGTPLMILMVGVGLYLTVRTRFFQITGIGTWMKRTIGELFKKQDSENSAGEEGQLKPFQALSTVLAGTIGSGVIAGVAAAIAIGGPGSVFWMWVIAFLGMATMYAETVCALSTRKVDADGNVRGGPVYYILEAFKGRSGKFLAALFAGSTIVSAGLSNFMVQSNSLASTLSVTFGISNWVTGFFLTVVCGFILKGSIDRMSAFTEKLVPIMSYLST